MQRQLRNLLEHKVAMGQGGDYYLDMSGMGDGYAAGEFVDLNDAAGGARRRRRHRKPAYMVKGSVAAKRHMAKIRRMKGHGLHAMGEAEGEGGRMRRRRRAPIRHRRGGEFVDLNDYEGGARKRYKHAKEGAFRNPIEKAARDYYKQEKSDDWLRTMGPEYASKLQKKAAIINRALAATQMLVPGVSYRDANRQAKAQLRALGPYAKAAQKYGLKVDAPAPDVAYTAAIAAMNAAIPARGVIPAYAPLVPYANIAALGADNDARLAAANALQAQYNALFNY